MPSSEDVRDDSAPLQHNESDSDLISQATAKVLFLDTTPFNEKFIFVTEAESIFHRRSPKGEIEEVKKRRGKGFPGGGVKETTEEFAWAAERGFVEFDPIKIAAIREGEEETGAPAAIVRERITDITWVRHSGWERHPWVLFYADGRNFENCVNRSKIEDPKLERIYKWDRIGWAYIRRLRDSILLPFNVRERRKRIAGGDETFYTGHLVALLAMLIKIEREDLFEVAFRGLSFHMMFSRPMLEMLLEFGRSESFLERLKSPTFHPDEEAARRIIRHFVGLELDRHIGILLERLETELCKKLEVYAQEQLELRENLSALYAYCAEAEGRSEEMEEATAAEPEVPPEDLELRHEDPFLHAALKALEKAI